MQGRTIDRQTRRALDLLSSREKGGTAYMLCPIITIQNPISFILDKGTHQTRRAQHEWILCVRSITWPIDKKMFQKWDQAIYHKILMIIENDFYHYEGCHLYRPSYAEMGNTVWFNMWERSSASLPTSLTRNPKPIQPSNNIRKKITAAFTYVASSLTMVRRCPLIIVHRDMAINPIHNQDQKPTYIYCYSYRKELRLVALWSFWSSHAVICIATGLLFSWSPGKSFPDHGGRLGSANAGAGHNGLPPSVPVLLQYSILG